MPQTLLINISLLAGTHQQNEVLRGKALQQLPVIPDAWLLIKEGCIEDFGKMNQLPEALKTQSVCVDVNGATVLPCWCDSHTHLVFAGSRETEFVDKLKGLSYADIAAKGGGILNSAQKLQAATEETLLAAAVERLQALMRLGTGAIEIKSGYGLTVNAELKMLRVIKELKRIAPIPVKATFLGAHTYPLVYKQNHEEYINSIIHEMLPVIAKEQLADYIDVFCEDGFFSVAEMKRIVKAGKEYGLKPKLHINQLNS
ncbi:MAG: hypothetical protein RLZZ316_2051, partial [Bacteroidota bacterium]